MRKAMLIALALAGCAHDSGKVMPLSTAQPWRDVATDADRLRVRNWRTAWTTALAKARAAGFAKEVADAGVVLHPDAALPDPRPPAGDYRCAVTKLGAKAPGTSDLVYYQPFACRISREGDALSFAKLDGAQRPVGRLFADNQQRMIFLGTLMLSDETSALQYGRDPERDTAGVFERIGADHWRLVLPSPRWESLLDVIDLVPAA